MTHDDIVFPVYYVAMPLNKDGYGPEMNRARAVHVQHEIWDQSNRAIASACDERTARLIAARLNLRL